MHTVGNLTLLTGPLNSKVSNGPWSGEIGKWKSLEAHDVLLLNNHLRKSAPEAWTHGAIRERTDEMAKMITEIWPVPTGHRSAFSHQRVKLHRRVDIADLLNAGLLTQGMTLYPGRKKLAGRLATLLPDGQIDVNGTAYTKPQAAATAIAGRPTNGWWFFRVDKTAGRSLRDILREYMATLAVDADGDESDGGDEEDDD